MASQYTNYSGVGSSGGSVAGRVSRRKPTPGISPKNQITPISPRSSGAINVPQAGGSQTQGRSGFTPPVRGNIQEAIRTYQSIPSFSGGGRPQVYAGGVPQQRFLRDSERQDSWRDRVYADRERSRRGGYPSRVQPQGQGSVMPSNVQPQRAIPVPELPQYQLPEYSPPGEDEGAYRTARREAMAPGERALRTGLRESISSSRSLDNPNARASFIRQALRGFGEGLERVSSGAGREARAVAGQKRSEQLRLYDTQYTKTSNEYVQNYQNQVNMIAQQFAQDQAGASRDYEMQFQPGMQDNRPGGRLPGESLSQAAIRRRNEYINTRGQ